MEHEPQVPARVSTGILPSEIDVRAEVAAGYEQFRPLGEGTMPDYIPALATANPDAFGVCVAGVNGQIFAIGDAETEFTIQSISKVFVFALVCDTLGPDEARRKLGSTVPGCRSTR
jgi:glutaminase